MKLKISFIENEIEFIDDKISIIEIENKSYFYRTIELFNKLYNGEDTEQIRLYENNSEINLCNQVYLIVDYFNMDLNTKRNINLLYKLISCNINENTHIELNKLNKKINSLLKKTFVEIDIPIQISNDFDINNYIKLFSPSIKNGGNLLERLMLIIDFERTFRLNKLIVFVNLKQYINEAELLEFYKYAIYNKVNIVLIELFSSKVINVYEKKLKIDSDLVEFVI